MSGLYAMPFGPLAVLLIVLLLCARELGRWLSRVLPVNERQFSTISALTLALVGLLLAFSFSLAADRYAVRRAATVQEANAIGTFWLRVGLLPEPVRSEMRSGIRRYVDLHFEHREESTDAARLAKTEAEAHALQREIWSLLLNEESHRIPDARLILLTAAMNNMIDNAATVLAANENRLPDALLLVLFLLTGLASLVVGYGSSTERRNHVLWVVLVVVLGGTLLVLVDMDRPRQGLIRAGVGPYVRLRESLQVEPSP